MHMKYVLRLIHLNSSFLFVFRNLNMVMRPFANIFRFEHPKGLKYGQLVLPFMPANFGPMYFSKITRNS